VSAQLEKGKRFENSLYGNPSGEARDFFKRNLIQLILLVYENPIWRYCSQARFSDARARADQALHKIQRDCRTRH
jgi:hypothetical protein